MLPLFSSVASRGLGISTCVKGGVTFGFVAVAPTNHEGNCPVDVFIADSDNMLVSRMSGKYKMQQNLYKPD